MKKTILGLDLGTNSIGWAVIKQNFDKKEGEILGMNSRIIPMSQDILSKFDTGQSLSQTADRTAYRGVRRLYQRDNLRRERLHRVLKLLDFLPEHYKNEIDFDKKKGQFKKEVKLNYRKNDKGKYEFIFMDSFNEMVKDFQNQKIPYDWTLYYLRKKALTEKLTKEELAWLILNFNQKRGYYQLRGDELSKKDDSKKELYYALKVIDVKETEDKNAKGAWFEVILEGGRIYKRQSKAPLDNWIGTIKEFIITETIDKKGNKKESYRVPKEDDWGLIKKKTEQDLDTYISQDSNHTVGTYIYETLLKNPSQKIRGKLIKTIERKYYKQELDKILNKQIELQPELFTKELYQKSILELYPQNEAHRSNIKDKNFKYLFVDDIIFYQRPLKSKKSTIGGCQYEQRPMRDKDGKLLKDENGNQVYKPVQAISKSHPLYQEFRLWQWLQNLRIYQNNDEQGNFIDKDVTNELLKTDEDYANLFDFLNDRADIKQSVLLGHFFKKKADKDNRRWNYPEDKTYPLNPTRAEMLKRIKKVKGADAETFLTKEIEQKLWHIIYSVKDPNEFEQALKTFANKHNLPENEFKDAFLKHPPYSNDYGAYSEKAIKKLLPLMRMGKHWDENSIPNEVKERINNIMERVKALNLPENPSKTEINKAFEKYEVTDDDIPQQLVKSFIPFINKNPLIGLNTYQAGYAVYNRHSEIGDIQQWKTTFELQQYFNNFKQHSLRNPIVEQVVLETLRTVKDIWDFYAKKYDIESFEKINPKTKKTETYYHRIFDEIHIELGRELKNPADKRKMMSQKVTENQNTNERIRLLLQEMINDGARPHSPSHQEILKIYEEGVLDKKYKFKISKDGKIVTEIIYSSRVPDNIKNILSQNSPSQKEIQRYKLWLEQGYISPYTGKIIPLSKLFTPDYQKEHIIPKSRWFNDSMSNKVICESEVNALKDKLTAYEFIQKYGGKKVNLGQDKNVEILKWEDYESHCNKYFKNNKAKLKNLLADEIPKDFISRQLNDSRYIAKLVKSLLGNIVRQEDEQEATPKNLISVTGAITSKLKQDWGLNDKWNELIMPRFERLNKLTGKEFLNDTNNKIVNLNYDLNRLKKKKISFKTFEEKAKHIYDFYDFNNENYIVLDEKKKLQIIQLRINELLNGFGYWDFKLNEKEEKTGKIFYRITIPNDLKKGFNKKRIDHRHHALDALVIASCTRKHIQYINSLNNQKEKYGLQPSLMEKNKQGHYTKHFKMPWQTFPTDAKNALDTCIVTFKQNLRVINRTNNKYWIYVDGKKQLVKQKGKNFAIRKPMHKETVSGALKEKAGKGKIYTAVRTSLSEIKNRKHWDKITDSGIKTILDNHLKNYINEKGKEDFEQAFSPEGIEEINKNIVSLNNGKKHQPIYKVRLKEEGSKFAISHKNVFNKNKKYVEAAKGTNLFFAIYKTKNKNGETKRVYETVPLNEVIEHQKQQAIEGIKSKDRTPIPIKHEKGEFLFTLSPNDLVYVPTNDEITNLNSVDFDNLTKKQVERIFLVNDFSTAIYFTPLHLATNIAPKEVDLTFDDKKGKLKGSYDTKTASFEGKQIKEICWKLKTDRLGNIIPIIK